MRCMLLLSVIISSLFFNGCPKPNEPDTRIYIESVDIWTNSATMKISVADTTRSWEFALSRDDSIVYDGSTNSPDTVIIDENLEYGSTYSYQASFMHEEEVVETSEVLTITTIGTTSHDVLWQVDTLGFPGSILFDVDVITADNIWAVGEIIMPDPDSSYNGTGKESFNVAHWDGIEWDIIQVLGGGQLRSIKYFDSDDIWVTTSGLPIHWDGTEWTLYHIQQMGLDVSAGYDIWGESTDDLYFVGYNGGFVHHDGSSFTKIITNSEIDYQSVEGNSNYVLAVGFSWPGDGTSELILIDRGEHSVTQIYEGPPINTGGTMDEYAGPLTSIYAFDDHRFLMSATYGLYLFDDRIPTETELIPINPIDLQTFFYGLPEDIDGNYFNDVYIVGHRGAIFHFNGMEFYQYPRPVEDCKYFNVSVKGLDIAIAGIDYSNGKALIVRGVKQ